jgi:hypothetical protein
LSFTAGESVGCQLSRSGSGTPNQERHLAITRPKKLDERAIFVTSERDDIPTA